MRHGVAQRFRLANAQHLEGMGRALHFFRAVGRLHGEEHAAGLDHRNGKLTQRPQVGHRTRNRHIEGRAVFLCKILRAGVHGGDVGQA